jgi:hypothetical protein
MAGLPPSNKPVDPRQVETGEWTEEGLGGYEAHRRRHPSEVIGTTNPPLVLDRHAHPDIRGPGEACGDLGEVLVALGEDLESMALGPNHYVEHPLDELKWDVRMKQIAHRVDEDDPWPFPLERLVESAGPKAQVESLLVRMAWNPPPTFGKRFGVAVRAARGHLRAPGHRVPRGLRPFDCAAVCQGSILVQEP